MSTFKTRLALVFATLTASAGALATQIVPEDYPVNYGIRAKPNILVSMDDSSSMDLELFLVGATEGLGYWAISDSFVENKMPVTSGNTDEAYSHLYPVGVANAGTTKADRYNGGAQFPGYTVPPFRAYGFMRNSDWNKSYYNPDITYRPWPSYGGVSWPEIDPVQAWLDPTVIDSALTSRFIDLTALTLGNRFGTGEQTAFNFRAGMWCDDNGTLLCSVDSNAHLDYWAATYYVTDTDTTSTYTYNNGTDSGDYLCSDFANGPVANVYQEFHDEPGWFSGVDAFAPDGSCLEQVEIRSDRLDYPSGRSYADELQNFANWFSYHRKRHQVARGALGYALQGISGVRTGLFWINNLRTVTMHDLDVPADVTGFLEENYYHVSKGGTPNSDALRHAANQFDRDDTADVPAIIQYSCQKNHTLMFTDGYNSSNTGSTGNIDSGKGAPYADDYSDTLADVAFHSYNRKLRGGDTGADGELLVDGRVPVAEACTDGTPDPWLDCNANLHMNTYAVSFGLQGRDVYGQSFSNGSISGTYEKVRDAYSVYPTWPNPADGQGATIDDLYHAAVNGRGEMYNATTPERLQTELQTALRQILAAEGSAAGLTFNSATLNADSLVFNTIFNTTNWTGDLIATRLNPKTGAPDAGIAWQAQETLDAQDWTSRHIVTYNGTDSTLFDWSNLTAAQQDDLKTSPSGTADSLGADRLAFLKGDRSNEGSLFRERTAVLGDMVSSTPAYVADTSTVWPDHIEDPRFGGNGLGESHSYFRDTVVRNRTPMIYVGVNDGMLHGFDATNGTGGGVERFAYIPSVMFSSTVGEGLHYLTDPDYTHRFYVDAEPAYTDVYVDRGGVEEWRTLLSGGFRTGAKGFYALDITDPAEFTAGNVSDRVMFEYSDTTDTHLGYMFERPSIGMLNNGEWALIYGNGYNSESDQGAIYVVFVERVLARGFALGDTFFKFPTGRTGAINGITTIDTGTDRVIDAVYASDAGGYIWKLDLSSSDEAQWGYAYPGPEPFFEARSGTGTVQPIITRPRVIKHTSVSDANNNAPNRMVIFGTGSMVENADLDNTDVQSFYAVWDDGSQNTARTRADLVASTVTKETNAEDFPVRTIGNSADPWKKQGFFFDMPGTGERILDYVDIRASRDTGGDYALFSSIIPDADVCNYGGSSWVMAADLASGKSPTYAVFDANQDGVIDDADAGIGGVFSSDYLVDFVSVGATGYGNTSTGKIVTIDIEEGVQSFSGRLGWQELIAR